MMMYLLPGLCLLTQGIFGITSKCKKICSRIRTLNTSKENEQHQKRDRIAGRLHLKKSLWRRAEKLRSLKLEGVFQLV